MLFNSFLFAAFLAVVLPTYYALPHRWQNRFIIAASYVFYGTWDPRFLLLLILSTVIDFVIAQAIESSDVPRRRKLLLLTSITAQLSILGFFKYFNFFVASASDLLQFVGLHPNLPLLHVILPVGVSFYTFQTMAYTIDVYRRDQEAVRDFVTFAFFVSYFPQLVAGPIERAAHLLPQLRAPRRVGPEQWNSAAQLILWGYVKKVAIADGLAPYADTVFAAPSSYGAVTLWLALYCFAVQIYCDFSGYSDIARGVSRLLGIELMENFRQPYLSRNITEFWRRWHISLSSWLRDYLYIPLGGNRHGLARQYRNLILTMLLGGLWHGAAWTFVIWGGLHGFYLAAHKFLTQGRRIGQEAPPDNPAAWAVFAVNAFITFHLVCLSWVFFRAPGLGAAFDYLGGMLSLAADNGGTPVPGLAHALVVYGLMALLLDLGCWLRGQELPLSAATPWWARGLVYAGGLVAVANVREYLGGVFIYFQF